MPIQNTIGEAITTPMQPTKNAIIAIPTAVQAATVWPCSACESDIGTPLSDASSSLTARRFGSGLLGQFLGPKLATE